MQCDANTGKKERLAVTIQSLPMGRDPIKILMSTVLEVERHRCGTVGMGCNLRLLKTNKLANQWMHGLVQTFLHTMFVAKVSEQKKSA